MPQVGVFALLVSWKEHQYCGPYGTMASISDILLNPVQVCQNKLFSTVNSLQIMNTNISHSKLVFKF